MKELLVDSSVLIDFLRNRNLRRELLPRLLDAGYLLSTTAINIGEVYSGAWPAELMRTVALLDTFHCYPIDTTIGREGGLLRSEYARRGVSLSLSDCLIAAVALKQNLPLFTDNAKDFPMPQLQLFNPTSDAF